MAADKDQIPRPIAPAEPSKPVEPAVKEHARCPHCWGMLKGVGVVKWHYRYSGTEIKYCYRCQKCGFDWTFVRKIEVQPIQTRQEN